MDSTGIYYLILLFQFFLLIYIYLREKSVLAPSVIFLFIIFITLLLSILSAPDYHFSIHALIYITLCLITFSLGSLLISKVSLTSENVNYLDFYKILFIFGLIFGFSAIISLINDSGFNYNKLTSLDNILAMSRTLTAQRYEGVRLSMITMFFLMLSYATCYSSGYLFVSSKKFIDRLIYITILFPILIFTLLYTARAVFIFGLLNFIAGIWLCFVVEKKLFKKYIQYLLPVSFLVALLFFITQSIRMGIQKFTQHNIVSVVSHLKVWLAGNYSSFSIWFDTLKQEDSNKGFYTLAGLSEQFGIGYRETGIYHTAFDVNGKMEFSNVYTLFRFILDDFGFSGSLIFFLFVGIASKYFYLKAKGNDLVSGSLSAGIIVLILFSFITSVWAYNTVLFSWIIYVMTNFLYKRKDDILYA